MPLNTGIKKADGHYLGGPFCYIEKGMGAKWKWLAKLFAVFGVLAGLLGIGTITQINGITSAVNNFFDPNASHIAFSIGENNFTWATVISGVLVTLCAALVIIGGIKELQSIRNRCSVYGNNIYHFRFNYHIHSFG